MDEITSPIGPQIPACDRTHAEKHRLPGESFREACNRVASALKDSDEHFHKLRQILLNMRYAFGGRVQMAMGSGRNVTAANCFVGGTIADSFVDDPGSIMERAIEAATTMRMGGGLGNNFSTLRPSGSLIKKLGSNSAGPVPFIRIFDAIGRATSSSGHRRGAQMAVLSIDHPDIIDFIHAKQNTTEFLGFNFSVAVTDEFMMAKALKKPFKLRWEGKTYREVDPEELWDQLMRSSWDWGEPGVLFIDTINRMNNLWYCERIEATNPCGEQPLPPYGACVLGSFNLTRYVHRSHDGRWSLDTTQLIQDIPYVVRALDNVLDRSRYPLPQQAKEAKNKRRIGIGVTGLANALEALGFPYGSPDFLRNEENLLEIIRDHAYAASALLAKEKGTFPLYDREKFKQGSFYQTLSPWVRELIEQHGIRNSHLLSIAPTGTMSFTLDNVSSGIEPVFAYEQERDILDARSKRTERIPDYGVHYFGMRGKRCADVTIQEHLDVLAVAAARVDSAVSKTCNIPPHIPWEDFKKVYDQAWERGCKGLTTFQPNGKRFAVLRSMDNPTPLPTGQLIPEGTACTFDPVSGRKSCE